MFRCGKIRNVNRILWDKNGLYLLKEFLWLYSEMKKILILK